MERGVVWLPASETPPPPDFELEKYLEHARIAMQDLERAIPAADDPGEKKGQGKLPPNPDAIRNANNSESKYRQDGTDCADSEFRALMSKVVIVSKKISLDASVFGERLKELTNLRSEDILSFLCDRLDSPMSPHIYSTVQRESMRVRLHNYFRTRWQLRTRIYNLKSSRLRTVENF